MKPYTDNTERQLDAELGRRIRTGEFPAVNAEEENGMAQKITWGLLTVLLAAIAAVGLWAWSAKADAADAKEEVVKVEKRVKDASYPKEKGMVLENAVMNITTILNEIKLDIRDIKKEQAAARRRGR